MTKNINYKLSSWLDGHFALITAMAGDAIGGVLVKVSGVVGDYIFGEICNSKGATGGAALVKFAASKVADPLSDKVDTVRLFPDLKAATSFAEEAEITLATDGPVFARDGDQPAPEGTGLFVGALE